MNRPVLPSLPTAVLLAIGTVPAVGCARGPATGPATTQYVNGHWFDGSGFSATPVCVSGGSFRDSCPGTVPDTVDLAGGYVIPPLADAHAHTLEGAWDVDDRLQRYLSAGVLYVRNLGSIAEFAHEITHRVSTPTSVDVVYAHAVLTSSRGHPVSRYEDFLREQHYEPRVGTLERGWFRGRGYLILDEGGDVDSVWAALMSTKPDVVKVILAYTEDHEANRLDPNPYLRRGLSPRLLPALVARAHARGLPVSAHVETATDFHHAVSAGVDDVAHLPAYYLHAADQDWRANISEQDAQLAWQRGIAVVTTASISPLMQRDPELLSLVQEYQRRNLELLRDHGVRIVIGSDWGDTPLEEIFYLRGLGVFDDLTLLKLAVEETPTVIFPDRAIGRLRDGFEANFVVLGGNPLQGFSAVHDVRAVYKSGVLIWSREGEAE